MKKVYNKLVRDRIPEVILDAGKEYEYRILDGKEYKKELIKKLYEEIQEFEENWDIEEMADIFEVLHGIMKAGNLDMDEMKKIRLDKRDKRGGFDEKIFLISVEEK